MRSCAWLVVWGGAHRGHSHRGLDDVHQFGGQGPSVKHSRHYHGASGVPSEVLVADPDHQVWVVEDVELFDLEPLSEVVEGELTGLEQGAAKLARLVQTTAKGEVDVGLTVAVAALVLKKRKSYIIWLTAMPA